MRQHECIDDVSPNLTALFETFTFISVFTRLCCGHGRYRRIFIVKSKRTHGVKAYGNFYANLLFHLLLLSPFLGATKLHTDYPISHYLKISFDIKCSECTRTKTLHFILLFTFDVVPFNFTSIFALMLFRGSQKYKSISFCSLLLARVYKACNSTLR